MPYIKQQTEIILNKCYKDIPHLERNPVQALGTNGHPNPFDLRVR